MNSRHHARLARELIDACGGLEESSAACRVNKSSLSDYQNACVTAFMPADVMADLEAYCGEPIYSRAIADLRPSEPIVSDALTETHEAVQAAAALLPLAMAMASGDPRAKTAFDDAVAKLVSEVADVQALSDASLNVTPIKRGA
jgi:hypothetical protein